MTNTATVTILFTDVVGSTNLRISQGDTGAQRALQSHDDLVRAEIERHSGREVKTIGDSFMVAFGSARRAVECAIAVQRALEGQPVQVRIGINTGEAIVQGGDYFGASVNAAERVMSAASGGQVLISEAVRTVLGVSQEFALKDRGKVELKGFPEPWQLYEVDWKDTAQPRTLAPTRSPFVGREEEKARLLTLLEDARRGQGSLVMIGGEPGVGKTRLAEEVGAEARRRGFFVVVGHCYETEGMPPYMPFIETTEYVARVVPPQNIREALGDGASEVMRLSPALRRVLPDVPPPPQLPPEEGRRHFFNAMIEFLARASRQQPLFMVLDDLHWADEATLMLIEQLAARLQELPVLVIGTYRDIELGTSRPLARSLQQLLRKRLAQDMLLRRLPESAVKQILKAHGRGDPPTALASLIYSETEGNAFFVEEVIRFLLEQGRLFDDEGSWLSDVAVSDVEVPRSVRLVIEQRLERLSPACRPMLTIAAIIGRNFDFELLEALAADDAALAGSDPLDALEEAMSASLIQDISRGRAARYTFTHELIRQTQLVNLSLPRRQRLHLRVAQAVEHTYAGSLESHIPELADHYRSAGAAADPEKAIAYSEKAAIAAQAIFAYEEAVSHWEASVELLDELEATMPRTDLIQRKAGVLERLGDLMLVGGLDVGRSVQYIERALKLYEEGGQVLRVAQMHSRIGRDLSIYPEAMDIPRAMTHYKAAEEVLSKQPVRAPLGYVYIGLATTALWACDVEGGTAAARRAIEIGHELGNDSLRSSGLALLGWNLFFAGRLKDGFESVEEGWRLAQRERQTFNTFIAAWTRGSLAILASHPSDAIKWFRDELDAPRLANAPLQQRVLVGQLVHLYSFVADVDSVQALVDSSATEGLPIAAVVAKTPREPLPGLKASAAEAGRAGNRWMQAYFTLLQTWLLRVAGDFEGATERGEEVLSIVSGLAPAAHAHCDLGIIAVERGEYQAAREHMARALDWVNNGEDWRGVVGRVRWLEALLLAAEGHMADSEQPFRAAIEVFERFQLRLDHADVLYYWARALLAAGRHGEASSKIDEAVAIYECYRVPQFFIDRVEAIRPAARAP